MQLIIFDLDGTLVDSLPDLVRTVNAVLADYAKPAVTALEVAPWIGRGSRVLFAQALQHHGIDTSAADFDFEPAFARFLQHYDDYLVGESQLYPGVESTLQALLDRGLKLAVCTNKPKRFVGPLLRHLGIAQHFAVWLGGDSLPQRKPDPEPLLHLARQFGADAGQCLMVGDSRHDVEAARSAGMAVVGVSYGYGGNDFVDVVPDRIIDSLQALLPWLDACKPLANN